MSRYRSLMGVRIAALLAALLAALALLAAPAAAISPATACTEITGVEPVAGGRYEVTCTEGAVLVIAYAGASRGVSAREPFPGTAWRSDHSRPTGPPTRYLSQQPSGGGIVEFRIERWS